MSILPIYDRHFPEILGSYQKDKFLRALSFCIKKKSAIDIGAHVGHWAYNLKQYFNQVHCFEPVPDNYKLLVKNVPGLNYYPLALLDVPGKLTLHLESNKNSGSWTAFPKTKTNQRMIEVKVKTLDSFNLSPDFIKMDVQNCEIFILRGSENTLTTHKPVLCLESFENKFKKEIHVFLKNLSYYVADRIGKEEIFVSN